MDDSLITTFLAVTGASDESVAKQYLEITNNDLDYAVTLYMESNPPGHAATATSPSPAAAHAFTESTHESDEALAQRLQQEAYGQRGDEDGVRAADANIHRHETLMDSFGPGMGGGAFMPQAPMSRPTDIFGQGRVGIFNQRFDFEDDSINSNGRFQHLDDDDGDEDIPDEDYPDEDEDAYQNDDDDDDDDEVMVLNSDGEVVESNTTRARPPRSRRRLSRDRRINELTSTQRRLANLFRPPFDIMSKIDLDTAKLQGRQGKKWILINIQDSSEFTCQVLNRDFWSQTSVKTKVKENFIFLQYQHDSPNGVNYTNFYSTDGFPHISILDPLTGERVFKWIDGQVPDVESWLDDVDQFLEKFSLMPNSKNPVVKHEVKFDPDALTEEQQIEFALKQSINENKAGQEGSSADDAIAIDEDDDQNDAASDADPTNTTTELDNSDDDPFTVIQAADHEQPTSGNVTRIQVRFPNGKRLIHKFEVDQDKVISIYSWLKFVLSQSSDQEYGLGSQDRFNLSNISNRSFRLVDALSSTIGEAGLKNASILLEKE